MVSRGRRISFSPLGIKIGGTILIRRREQIVALINEEGQISFSKLKESFPDISDMTLRTDLKYLDEMGKVIRIHGGARSVETLAGTDGLYLARATRKQSEN